MFKILISATIIRRREIGTIKNNDDAMSIDLLTLSDKIRLGLYIHKKEVCSCGNSGAD